MIGCGVAGLLPAECIHKTGAFAFTQRKPRFCVYRFFSSAGRAEKNEPILMNRFGLYKPDDQGADLIQYKKGNQQKRLADDIGRGQDGRDNSG